MLFKTGTVAMIGWDLRLLNPKFPVCLYHYVDQSKLPKRHMFSLLTPYDNDKYIENTENDVNTL